MSKAGKGFKEIELQKLLDKIVENETVTIEYGYPGGKGYVRSATLREHLNQYNIDLAIYGKVTTKIIKIGDIEYEKEICSMV